MPSYTPDNLEHDKLLLDILHAQLPQKHEGNDHTKSDDAIIMRTNHKYGTRCPQCGRMVAKILKVPSVRTCPGCRNRYEIARSGRGLSFSKMQCPDLEEV